MYIERIKYKVKRWNFVIIYDNDVDGWKGRLILMKGVNLKDDNDDKDCY